MNNLANKITVSRMIFSLVLALAVPFSPVFWICYIYGGISDLIDGFVARKFHQKSRAGAKLDSIADLMFAVSLLTAVVRTVSFPSWIWVCMALTTSLRIISYGIGFYKYHTLAALHTTLNKATGAVIFAFPLLYAFLGFHTAAVIVCLLALISSVEEIIITIKSSNLNLNCKCFLKQ